ncbi:UDP-glucose 4-epimerase GalE [Flavobacterium sp. I3-2]|uniref:UDP-glucose 4-epimerase GalE n=1 Tax=Flavobacterium sp. I3-2 TaxID=2748319 RepID=UPI0015AABAD6|nr:UDP-glucose 4-epimerase GalE [Flavobacterium sp. I3-2]
MKKILVTGGLGYIGSHVVVVLQEAGFDVTIIDDFSNSSIKVLENIFLITGIKPSFFEIDLKDKVKVDTFFKANKIDGIIHFAAYKAVGESVQKPLDYYRNNLEGLLNVLESMEQYQIDNFIFSSSCSVYGQADQMPIIEKTPLKRAESPYGKTKAMGEEIISDFTKAMNKNAISLRYFNPVGSHKSYLLGDKSSGIPNNLLPYITQTASGLREQLIVFGKDYETKDGTAIRDYVDVNDIADAHVLALQYLLHKKNKDKLEFFNLGSGTGSTVLEIIEAFERANNLKIPYTISNRREGDIQEAYADFSKAKEKLHWQPKTSLEISMKTAWEFEKKLKENEFKIPNH